MVHICAGVHGMSTTGHYTRYINQFPGWSDNCDTMYQYIPSPLDHNKELGYYQVEHCAGNKTAWCEFRYYNPHFNYWIWEREQTNYIGPFKSGGRHRIIEYTGKNAIQHVLESAKNLNVSDMVNLIFKDQFYNRSYVDHFRYYQEETNV